MALNSLQMSILSVLTSFDIDIIDAASALKRGKLREIYKHIATVVWPTTFPKQAIRALEILGISRVRSYTDR